MVARPEGLAARSRRAVDYFDATLAGRCLRRYRAIDGRDRTLALAGQAFTTLIPLLIVSAALASDEAVARHLVDRFGLSGASADAVRLLFSRPPGTTATITALGVVVLFYSTLSFTRALQRTWEAAHELPKAGMRGTLHAVTGFALLVTQILVLAVLANAFSGHPAGDAVGFVLRVVVAVGVWLQLQYLLLSRRVPRAQLVPGAIVAGIGQVVVSFYSALWMPHLIAVDAARYGVIGVTFALLTWLIVIAVSLVAAGVVSGEMRLHGTLATAAAVVPAETTETTETTGATEATEPGETSDPGETADPSGTTGPADQGGPDDPVEQADPDEQAGPVAPDFGARRRLRGVLAAVARADRTDRFGTVLVLTVVTVVWTAGAPAAWWARLLVLFLQTATLLSALRAARAGPRTVGAIGGIWIAGVLVAAVAALFGADAEGLSAALGTIFMTVALVTVLRRLVQQPEVSPSTVAGAISAYLLLGLVFTWAYAFLAALGDDPLTGTTVGAGLNEYLYFAFTTLTTTGFGDLAPATDTARAVVILEALLGQLYLVTVLALVIGNMRPRRNRRNVAPDA